MIPLTSFLETLTSVWSYDLFWEGVKFLDENDLKMTSKRMRSCTVSNRINPFNKFPKTTLCWPPRHAKQSYHNEQWDQHCRKIAQWSLFQPYAKFTTNKQIRETTKTENIQDSTVETFQETPYFKHWTWKQKKTLGNFISVIEQIATSPSKAHVRLTPLEERENSEN